MLVTTSRASGGVAVLPKHISVLIVNHLLHHRVTGPNLCHHGGRLSTCEIEAVQILSRSSPGLRVRRRGLMAITGTLARLLCTNAAWLNSCNHSGLLPRPILWRVFHRRCHLVLCSSSRKKEQRVSCRTETCSLTLECLPRCLGSSSSHLAAFFFFFVFFFHNDCGMNLSSSRSSSRICSGGKPAARIYQRSLIINLEISSAAKCMQPGFHFHASVCAPKTKEMGRLNGAYDPGSWAQGAAGRLHRVVIPPSPDDFTGTPVHTQLAYLIASSRVTVSTAPPSGTAPPP